MNNPKKYKITLSEDQYLSDKADELPTENGIHLVLAKTGVGKSTHMLKDSHLKRGTSVFPVKAIMKQQTFYRDEKNLHLANIVQVEKLSTADVKNVLHIDEAQNTFMAGYRKSFEDLIDTVKERSKVMPVFLYSGSMTPSLMALLPFEFTSITTVDKKFERDLRVVCLSTKRKDRGDINFSEVKNNTTWIAYAVNEIRKQDCLPTILFLNSLEKAQKVSELLKKLGHNFLVVDSTRIEKNREVNAAYNYITKNQALPEKYDGIISTISLSEGIDINQEITIISIQSGASTIFQEQGRIRNTGKHWLLTGSGTDRLEFHDGKLYTTQGHFREIADPNDKEEELKTEECHWVNAVCKSNATLYSRYAKECLRGYYASFVIEELGDLGYKRVEEYEYDISSIVAEKVSSSFIGKKKLIKAIVKLGCECPTHQYVKDDPLINYLTSEVGGGYTLDNLEPISAASEWEHQCQKMKANGFDIDVWHSYSILKEIGRRFFINIFAQKDMKIFDDRIDVLTDMYDFITSVGGTMTSNRRKNNSIPDDCLTQLSDSFWGEYIRSKTSEWFYEENKNERLKVFKILMGMRVESSGNWTFINKKPSWDVALTNAEGNKFRARAKHIPDIPKFCEHFGVDRKQITQMKTKEIKAMVSELQSLSEPLIASLDSLESVIDQINF